LRFKVSSSLILDEERVSNTPDKRGLQPGRLPGFDAEEADVFSIEH